jgi:UDP-N-acetylmuramoylalanine--D-glutamate ligase
MKPRPPLPAGPYLIVGLARSGVAAALTLTERGEQVTGVDSGRPDVERLVAAGVAVHLESDGVALLGGIGCVVKSPGVPARAPVVEAARRRGVAVIGELELAWRMLPNEFIAVTGTNGKTTTVELVGHIHREAALPVAVAGNVGTAVSGLAGHIGREVTVVCEASSFQLEDTSEFSPEAAVLLNLTPDHLDRHGSMESYRSAKLQAFTRQGNDDVAVAPLVLPGVTDLGGCARRVLFGHDAGAAVSERAGELWWEEQPLVALTELPLRGAHNVDNAMAAAAVCLARGVAADAVRSGLRSFAGVAHRLEEVARRDGVVFVNDSKATNVQSTLVALASFAAASVHLIAGGQSKGQSFAPLRAAVAAACQAVYLIGQDADAIADSLHSAGVPLHRCGDLEHAVAAAGAAAREGEVVLLSPACASFDQFADFEDRGERFRELASRSALRT